MNQKLIDTICEWFKKQYSEDKHSESVSKVEYFGNKSFRLTNNETGEVKEITFSGIETFTDFEEYKIRMKISSKLEDEINNICEETENKYCWQKEIDEALSNNTKYQALNRLYEEIMYSKVDKTKVFTE